MSSHKDRQVALELILSKLRLKVDSAPKTFRIEWVRGKLPQIDPIESDLSL
jgi:hypothetical protein